MRSHRSVLCNFKLPFHLIYHCPMFGLLCGTHTRYEVQGLVSGSTMLTPEGPYPPDVRILNFLNEYRVYQYLQSDVKADKSDSQHQFGEEHFKPAKHAVRRRVNVIMKGLVVGLVVDSQLNAFIRVYR